jgi:hypothetical protein
MYRGAEPIKGFAIYSVPTVRAASGSKGKMIDLIIADKYVDIDLDKYYTRGERLTIVAVDRNNNVSEELQLK